MKNQIKLIMLLLLTIVLGILTFTQKSDNSDENNSINTYTTNIFTLKIINNELCLQNNDKTVKKYEINPSVLPSEDIYLLTQGICVKDESEADSIAENFDG